MALSKQSNQKYVKEKERRYGEKIDNSSMDTASDKMKSGQENYTGRLSDHTMKDKD